VRDLGPFIWDREFLVTAGLSARNVLSDLAEKSPALAEKVRSWLALRCDVDRPADYFTNPESLPVLALPWWLEKAISGSVDVQLQADIMYSSISLYYFSRMLDDVMDGHQVDFNALPALYLLYDGFQKTYHKYFKPSDPFWEVLGRLLTSTAETAVIDATITDFTEAEFIQIASKKTAAGAIPLAGVSLYYGRADLLPSWEALFALIARWHQMRDDLIDWSADYKSGNRTWLLCEAERQRTNDQSVSVWIGRKGFAWALSVMEQWMQELLKMTSHLGCPELLEYLQARRQSFARYIGDLTAIAAAAEPLLQMDAIQHRV
jgi:hypothetical protein